MDKIKMFEMMQKLNPGFINEAPTFNSSFGDSFNSSANSVSNGIDNATNFAQSKVTNVIDNKIDQKNNITYNEAGNYSLQTYGDLKNAINAIQTKQKTKKIAGVGVDTIIGAIPFIGNAKTIVDFFKAAINKPDDKKTNTWLDKLDIDDDTSKIVDDAVENGFLGYIVNKINSTPNETPLDPDFNMNDELSEYLKITYNNRTVSGYQE